MGKLKFSNIYTLFSLLVLGISTAWLLLSCGGQPPQPYGPPGPGQGNPSVVPNQPTTPDPRNRGNCQDGGNPCEGDSTCEDICDDIFSKSKSKSKCKKLSTDMVNEFYNIFEILDEGEDLDSINHQTLDCLLDISETEFTKEVGTLTSRDTKSFLETLAAEEDLAQVLSSADKEYKILAKLLDNISGTEERLDAFSTGVEGSSTFIDLIIENDNEEAWEWVTGYVTEQCQTSPYCDKLNAATYTGNHSEAKDLVFFCKVFKDASVSDVRALVENEFFYDTYGDFIEGLTECGASNNKIKCQADNQAHFLHTDSSDNLSVCSHVAGVTTD